MDYNFLQGYLQSECVSPSLKNYAQICDISRRQQQHLVSRSVELVFLGRVRQGLWVSPCWTKFVSFGNPTSAGEWKLGSLLPFGLGVEETASGFAGEDNFHDVSWCSGHREFHNSKGVHWCFSMISSNRVPFGRDFFVDWAISSESYFLRCKVEVKAKCFCKIFLHGLVSRAS